MTLATERPSTPADARSEWYYSGRTLNPMQVIFSGYAPDCRERYFLGTPGCGKTTALIQEVNRACERYPGSWWLLSRYTELESASTLKGDFEREIPRERLLRWDHEERCWYYPNGSKVTIHGLKPSEDQGRYAKFAGYNLSGVALSQVEAIPQDVVEKLYERLRSPVPPRVLLAEGNLDLGPDHWLVAVAEGGRKIQDRLIRAGPRLVVIGNLQDNTVNLPEDYVAKMRGKFPEGHPEYWTRVGGWFGSRSLGEPVYGPSFYRPEVHLATVDADPSLPLFEGWDFGITRPAILWSQVWPGGRWRFLGEFLGDGIGLDEVIAERRRILSTWFPTCRTVWSVGDPTGENRKDTGVSSMLFLRTHGVPISRPRKGANHPGARSWAIQQTRELLGRHTSRGEAFGVHPRCKVFAEGLLKGYVRNPHSPDMMPLKDGYYDHLQNCAEYVLQAYWGTNAMPDLMVPKTFAQLLSAREPGEPRDRRLMGTRHPGGF